MTKENLIKMHNHFSKLAAGDFTARDFDEESESSCDGEDGGMMRMGKLTPERIALVKSTALTNKLEMEVNHPELKDSKPTPTPETDSKKKSKTKDKE